MKNKNKLLLMVLLKLTKIMIWLDSCKNRLARKIYKVIKKVVDIMWYPIIKNYYLKGYYTDANLLVFVTAEMITEEQMLEMIEEKKAKEEAEKEENK